MAHDPFPTELLLKNLFKTDDLSRFMDRYGERMKPEPFNRYIGALCAAKETVPERVILKSGIARTYGHQIFSGARNPSRDKVIQLAFGFEMNYDEAQALLKAARKSALYPKIERDAALIYALNKKLGVEEAQDLLKALKIPVLGKEDAYG